MIRLYALLFALSCCLSTITGQTAEPLRRHGLTVLAGAMTTPAAGYTSPAYRMSYGYDLSRRFGIAVGFETQVGNLNEQLLVNDLVLTGTLPSREGRVRRVSALTVTPRFRVIAKPHFDLSLAGGLALADVRTISNATYFRNEIYGPLVYATEYTAGLTGSAQASYAVNDRWQAVASLSYLMVGAGVDGVSDNFGLYVGTRFRFGPVR